MSQSITIRIEATELPGATCGGHTAVMVGLQVRDDVIDLVSADAPSATWSVDATLTDALSFRGPAIHGRADERFLYLSWHDGHDRFRRAKLQLDAVPRADLIRLLHQGGTVVARLGLTDELGMPRCASVRPPKISWSVELAARESAP